MLTDCDQHLMQRGVLKDAASKAGRLQQQWRLKCMNMQKWCLGKCCCMQQSHTSASIVHTAMHTVCAVSIRCTVMFMQRDTARASCWY